jgi:G8 domain
MEDFCRRAGKLVVRDDGTARRIRIRHMVIQSNGEFWVGSATCPFESRLDIVLYGRSDATDINERPIFGRKFIGVAPTGSIVIYGVRKLSWTFLQTTISPGLLSTLRSCKTSGLVPSLATIMSFFGLKT